MKTTMKDLYKEERPYEKCLACGPGALSDPELLAVILRSGVSGSSAVALAGSVLEKCPHAEGLLGIHHLSLAQLTEIRELATVTYAYTNMAQFENSNDFYGVKIPFTTKSFILTYDGTIKAGVDLEAAEVAISGDTVTVTLPEGLADHYQRQHPRHPLLPEGWFCPGGGAHRRDKGVAQAEALHPPAGERGHPHPARI